MIWLILWEKLQTRFCVSNDDIVVEIGNTKVENDIGIFFVVGNMQWPREFVEEFVDPNQAKNVKLSHKYTARYPMLKKKTYKKFLSNILKFLEKKK